MKKEKGKGVYGKMGDQKTASDTDLSEESVNIFHLIGGKKVEKVYRPRSKEIVIFFADGTRFFIDSKAELEFSIT